MKVITGGGFIGGALHRALPQGQAILVTKNMLDLSETSAEIPRAWDTDTVFHCAAKTGGVGGNGWSRDDSIYNLAMTLKLLRSCGQMRPPPVFVYISSGICYSKWFGSERFRYAGKPHVYWPGITRRFAERVCESYSTSRAMPCKVVRLANVYGPGDNFDLHSGHAIAALVAKFCGEGPPVQVLGDGTARRHFIHIDDAVSGIIMASREPDRLYNVCHQKSWRICDVVDYLCMICDVDPQAVKYGAGPSGARYIKMSPNRLLATGWVPKWNLPDGLRDTVEWYRKNRC